MALAETFNAIVESFPDDWTDLELDLRILDERQYVDAAVLLVTCNAQPYSKHDWHWRLLVAHRFGHAAAAPAVQGAASRKRICLRPSCRTSADGVSSPTSEPLSMTATRSASASASSR